MSFSKSLESEIIRWTRVISLIGLVGLLLLSAITVGEVISRTVLGLPVIGVDILPGAVPLETASLPERCVLLFGQEGPGLSATARQACSQVCSIAQFGSTRSINAGVASGIAMHEWIKQHRLPSG